MKRTSLLTFAASLSIFLTTTFTSCGGPVDPANPVVNPPVSEYNKITDTGNSLIIEKPLFTGQDGDWKDVKLTTNEIQYTLARNEEGVYIKIDNLGDYQTAIITVKGNKLKSDEENIVVAQFEKTDTYYWKHAELETITAESKSFSFDIPQGIYVDKIIFQNKNDGGWKGDFSFFIEKIELKKDASKVPYTVTQTSTSYIIENPQLQSIWHVDIEGNKINFKSVEGKKNDNNSYSAAYWELKNIADYDRAVVTLKGHHSSSGNKTIYITGYSPYSEHKREVDYHSSRQETVWVDKADDAHSIVGIDLNALEKSLSGKPFKALEFANNETDNWAITIEKIELFKINKNTKDLVIFDPADTTSYTVENNGNNNHEVVTGLDGNKYLKITPYEHDVNIKLSAAKDIQNYMYAKALVYTEDESNNLWMGLGLRYPHDSVVFDLTRAGELQNDASKTPVPITGMIVNTKASEFTAYIQNKDNNYEPFNDKTIYIGKIIATANQDPSYNPFPVYTAELKENFAQSYIAPSAYTYPEKSKYPELVETNQEVPDTLTTGTPVLSEDKIIGVVPQSNGLMIYIDYTAVPEAKTWANNTIRVKDITYGDNIEPVDIENFEVKKDEDGSSISSKAFFPFTEAGRKYKVDIIHMNKSWQEWGSTEYGGKSAVVTAIGGYGRFYTKAEDATYYISEGKRKLDLHELTAQFPWNENYSYYLDLMTRVNTRDYYDGNLGKEYKSGNVVETLTFDDDVSNYIAGQSKIFFELKSRIYAPDDEGRNLKYSQIFYKNDDKWFSDVEASTQRGLFPIIKIVSTENEETNGFVTEPIAHHVKDQAHGWENHAWLESIPDPWYEKCTIGVNDGTPATGQVKVRGNWTTSYDKKSLRIKFDKKQNLCGLNGGEKFKNWVLLAVWKDASFLRDATGLKMFKALFPDYYASDCKLVEVEVNGVYMGVYLLAEQQETKENRINITEAEKDSSNTNIGYFIEFDSYYTSEAENERFEINYGDNITDYEGRILDNLQKGYTIKSDVYSEEQKNFIMKYMNRLWSICYNASYNNLYFRFKSDYTLEQYEPEGTSDDEKCKNCISEVIDITSLANMYIFNELVCDPDLYLTSFLMDIDFAEGKDHKLRFEAPWDFDSTMGNKRFNNLGTDACNNGINEMFAGLGQSDVNGEDYRTHGNPWMVIFIKQAWFQKLLKDQWNSIKPTETLNKLISFIDENSASQYEPAFNYTRNFWGTPAENGELCAYTKDAAKTSQAASAKYLKDWLTARFSAVDTIIKSLTTK